MMEVPQANVESGYFGGKKGGMTSDWTSEGVTDGVFNSERIPTECGGSSQSRLRQSWGGCNVKYVINHAIEKYVTWKQSRGSKIKLEKCFFFKVAQRLVFISLI